jgi:hypothetical protein
MISELLINDRMYCGNGCYFVCAPTSVLIRAWLVKAMTGVTPLAPLLDVNKLI